MVHEKAFVDLSNADQAVQQTMKQAQIAVAGYFDWLQNTMSATPWGKTDLIEKCKKYTGSNMIAMSECMHKMGRAKDLKDVIEIQTDFMHTQVSSFVEQAKDLGQTFAQAASGALKPPSA